MTVLYKYNKCNRCIISNIISVTIASTLTKVVTITPTNKRQKVIHKVIHLYTLYDKMDSITK